MTRFERYTDKEGTLKHTLSEIRFFFSCRTAFPPLPPSFFLFLFSDFNVLVFFFFFAVVVVLFCLSFFFFF